MNQPTCRTVPRVLMGLGVVAALSPPPVWACTVTPGPPTLIGQPANRAEAVPTNVSLHYLIPVETLRFDDPPDKVPGEYTLRAASGEQVPLVVARPSESLLELTPLQALQPNTAYTLEAHWQLPSGAEADTALTFGTGSGPVEEAPPPPSVVLQHYELMRNPIHTCAPPRTGSCISVQDDRDLYEYTLVDVNGEETEPSFIRGSLFTMYLYGRAQSASYSCVDVRQFGANGLRSQALRLCADEAPLLDLTDRLGEANVGCSAAGLEWCVSTGESGIEPGPAEPRGVDGAIYCPLDPELQAIESAQRAVPMPDDDPEEPEPAAAQGCSVAAAGPAQPGGLSSLFTLVANLGLLLIRRRRAPAER